MGPEVEMASAEAVGKAERGAMAESRMAVPTGTGRRARGMAAEAERGRAAELGKVVPQAG